MLHRRLAAVDSELVATANHGFGWDCVRLAAETLREVGSDAEQQVSYLESLKMYPGATGFLTFTAGDTNGRAPNDPTTIAQITGGRYVTVSTLGR